MKKQIKISDDFFPEEKSTQNTAADKRETMDSAAMQVILGTRRKVTPKTRPAAGRTRSRAKEPSSEGRRPPVGMAAVLILPFNLAGAVLRFWGILMKSTLPRLRD